MNIDYTDTCIYKYTTIKIRYSYETIRNTNRY